MLLSAALSVACVGVAISTELGGNDDDLDSNSARKFIREIVPSKDAALVPGIVAAVFMTLYFISFGLGWVAIPWLYPAEVNSLAMRTKGASLATACDWLFNWLVVQTTPPGIHYLKWGIYLIYAVLNAAFIPLIYYFVVETAGLSLEEIDGWFAANPGWRVDKASTGMGRVREGEEEGEERRGLVREEDKAERYDGDAREVGMDDARFVLEDSDEETEDLRDTSARWRLSD